MTTESAVPAQAPTAPAAPAPVASPAAPEATPPAAPAASAPVAAPAPAATPAPDTKAQSTVFEPTGNAGLDLALDFVGGLGLGPDHAAIVAAEGGDFGPLEAVLGALGDKAKGWERYTALAKAAWADVKAKAEAEVAAQQKLVVEAAGGEDRWAAIKTWASTNAEPAEREQVNAALKAGGIAAKAMVSYLRNLYEQQPGAVVPPKDPLAPGAAGTPGAADAPLTRQAYTEKVAALSRKLGGRLDGHPEYVALQQARARARNAGY